MFWSMCRETWDVCSSFLHVLLGRTGWGKQRKWTHVPRLPHMLQGGDTRGLVCRDRDLPPSGAWRRVNPLRPRFPVPLLQPPHHLLPPLSSAGATLPQLSSFLVKATMSLGLLFRGTQSSLWPNFHTDHSAPLSSLTETSVQGLGVPRVLVLGLHLTGARCRGGSTECVPRSVASELTFTNVI